jgi:UMF1 family MFS transporter
VSTFLLLLLLPLKGAVIDRYGLGRQLLFATSVLIGISAILLYELGHKSDPHWRIIGTLVLFGFINLLYQASLVSYNWMLPHLRGVRNPGDIRRVSGLGEAAGSLGSVAGALFGVLLLTAVLRNSASPRIDLFLWLGLLYLALFLVDYFLLRRGIQEGPPASQRESFLQSVRSGFDVLGTRNEMRRFLFAFFVFADALLTVQLFLPIYMRERLLFDDTSASAAFALSLTAASLGAGVFAYWGRGRSPKVAIEFTLVGCVFTLVVLGFIESRVLFFILMALAGVEYGVLWSASRAYVIEMTPTGDLGRTLGLYAVFERCASMVGPLLWGAVMFLPITVFGRYVVAFAFMAGLVLTSVVVLVWNRADWTL